MLRGFGAVIGCPEVPYGPRLTSRIKYPSEFRHLLHRAAVTSDGIMIPMRLELGATVAMDRRGAPDGSIPANMAKPQSPPKSRKQSS